MNKPPQNLSIEELAERLPQEFRKAFNAEYKQRSSKSGKLRVYSDGCFDLFHYGHARQFEQVKNMFPNVELIVGVCSDVDIKNNKGMNVMNDYERCEAVRHCKWVDEVIPKAPWLPTLDFLDLHKIDFIAHDAVPYPTPGNDDCYHPIKLAGRFLPTLRSAEISTTDLLVRVLRDKDEYYDRNFSKGYTLKDFKMGYIEYAMYLGRKVMGKIVNGLEKTVRKEKEE